jgi:hypothetical protein
MYGPVHTWQPSQGLRSVLAISDRDGLQEAQQPAHLTAHRITMAQLHRDNRYSRMTDTFQQLVGRAPISAAEFARRHAATFTPA